MALACFEPTDHNIKKTDLKAIGGSKLRYEFAEEVSYCNVKSLKYKKIQAKLKKKR